MARPRALRQRKTSYGRSSRSSPRQTSYDFGVPIGIGYKTGRRALTPTRSVPRSVLPSYSARSFSLRLTPGPFRRAPVRSIVVVRKVDSIPRVRSRTLRYQLKDLALPRNPELRSDDYNFCRQRSMRKGVMFALDVAGRKWGRGGPNMRHSRRGESSNFTCR